MVIVAVGLSFVYLLALISTSDKAKIGDEDMAETPAKRLKIGLFGGSFNPPTTAHLALAQYAHEHVRMDQLWWLVAPQNPFKPKQGMADFAHRIAMCELAAQDHPWLVVSDWEARLGTQQTADTLKGIRQHNPDSDFIWLMGADNLVHFHMWDDWRSIADSVPIAVFSRPGDVEAALQSPAAQELASHRVYGDLPTLKPGQWALFTNPEMAVSATAVRQALAAGQEPSNLLPVVTDYIRTHKLYTFA